MGEILIFMLLVSIFGFFLITSFLFFCAQFFLFSVFLSLILGFYRRGWLGILAFLVFIGGILVILFYLGMYGTYYSLFNSSQRIFLFLLLFLPVCYFKDFYISNLGENSLGRFNIFFLGLISLFLYFLLFGVRKILGVGSAMRRFF